MFVAHLIFGLVLTVLGYAFGWRFSIVAFGGATGVLIGIVIIWLTARHSRHSE